MGRDILDFYPKIKLSNAMEYDSALLRKEHMEETRERRGREKGVPKNKTGFGKKRRGSVVMGQEGGIPKNKTRIVSRRDVKREKPSSHRLTQIRKVKIRFGFGKSLYYVRRNIESIPYCNRI